MYTVRSLRLSIKRRDVIIVCCLSAPHDWRVTSNHFQICDQDNDGLLNDKEMSLFQVSSRQKAVSNMGAHKHLTG